MDHKRVELDPTVASDVIAELIYRRVRGAVNCAELTMLEIELRESLHEIVGKPAPDEPPTDMVAAHLIDLAWQRVEAEWKERRDSEGWFPSLSQIEKELDEIDPPQAAPSTPRRKRSK